MIATNPIRILVADDDRAILDLYQRVLSPVREEEATLFADLDGLAGLLFGGPRDNPQPATPAAPAASYELVQCQQGDEAVDMVTRALEEHRPFAVAFLDVRMPPGPDGVWAAERIRALDSHIEIVMVTGYSDLHPEDIAHRVSPAHKLLYIQKPFHPQEITQFAAALGTKWQMEWELRQAHNDLVIANEDLRAEIDARTRAEEALREREVQYRTVLESAPDPVVVYDTEKRAIYLNIAFSRVFGWTLDEMRGQTLEFVPIEYLPDSRLIFEKIRQGETISGVETARLTKEGDRVEVSISGAGFFDDQGMLQGSVITIQDITERKKTEEEVRFIAYHDPLTGLPNRKSFYVRLENELLQSSCRSGEKRHVTDSRWALLFLDLNKFKDVNDTLGHDAGDELLQVVATRIRTCLRKSDYLFRLGGDEFTIILNDLRHDTDVAKVVEKIREEVARPCRIKEHDLYVNVSIGISVYPEDGENVETLVKNADMAMYAAKGEGHGYRFFTEEMNMKALERMQMESHLRTALHNDQFMIYYQPLVDKQQQIIGMEALLRWQHPEMDLIGPEKFIPLAEETGAIVPIGKWVLYTACQQAKTWHDAGHTEFYVAVNLSTRQFKDPDLVEMVVQALEATGLPPHCLRLEVTESGIMDDPEQAVVKMQLLRDRGIHFAIDDFGAGYSSLSYLKRFPIDTLKIDRSFVQGSLTNKDDQEIIKTILSMARSLNMKTVAEGVETKDQHEFLTRQGCQMMQGYYHGRPVSADTFEATLRKKST